MTMVTEALQDCTKLNEGVLDTSAFNVDGDITQDILYEREEVKKIMTTLIRFYKFPDKFLRTHLMIFGGTGTGKTKLVLYVLDMIKKEFEQANDFDYKYFNCKNFRTSYSLFKALTHMGEKAGYTMAVEAAKLEYSKSNKTTVIVLDEVDLFKDDDIIYFVSRFQEFKKVVLIMITKEASFFQRLSPDVKSSLMQEFISFPEYNVRDLLAIFKKRCDKGLVSYDGSLLNAIAHHNVVQYNADARIGVKTLYHLFVEKSQKNFKEIMAKAQVDIKNNIITGLHNYKIFLLYKLHKNPTPAEMGYDEDQIVAKSTTLFNLFEQEYALTRPLFLTHIDEMERLGLIYTTRERAGRSFIKAIHSKLHPENFKLVTELYNKRELGKRV